MNITDEMIERGAKALYELHPLSSAMPFWEDLNDRWKTEWREKAKAVIEATVKDKLWELEAQAAAMREVAERALKYIEKHLSPFEQTEAEDICIDLNRAIHTTTAGRDLLERVKKLEAEVNEHRERANDYQTRWEMHQKQDCAIRCARELEEILGTDNPVETVQKVKELEAQAVAMREALTEALSLIDPITLHNNCPCRECVEDRRIYQRINEALSSSAGRDLLEWLKKLEAVTEAARRYLERCICLECERRNALPLDDDDKVDSCDPCWAEELEEALKALEGGERSE